MTNRKKEKIIAEKVKPLCNALTIQQKCVLTKQLEYNFETVDDAVENMLYVHNNCTNTIISEVSKIHYKSLMYLKEKLKLNIDDIERWWNSEQHTGYDKVMFTYSVCRHSIDELNNIINNVIR